MTDRIAHLQERLEEPLLVTNLVNIRYLCGFDSSNAALLVRARSARGSTPTSATSARRARSKGSRRWRRVARSSRTSPRCWPARIGFETVLPYAQYQVLARGGLELVPRSGLVEQLRAVKDESELERIRRIAKITDRVFEQLPRRRLHRQRASSTSRGTSLGSSTTRAPRGSRSSSSSAPGRPGRIRTAAPASGWSRQATLVVVDAGCSIGGYSSDYTRTFATGPGRRRAEGGIRRRPRRRRRRRSSAIRAGVPAIDGGRGRAPDHRRRPVRGQFGHGLGHGLGLEVHEAPRMSPESGDVLAAGNVVTVEPGIYVEGRFGVRIEDDVVVTADGIENLTASAKDLVEVG